jgi:hypothetical protein
MYARHAPSIAARDSAIPHKRSSNFLMYPVACSPGIVPARILTCTFARHAGNGFVE